jgi:hypothetical protein
MYPQTKTTAVLILVWAFSLDVLARELRGSPRGGRLAVPKGSTCSKVGQPEAVGARIGEGLTMESLTVWVEQSLSDLIEGIASRTQNNTTIAPPGMIMPQRAEGFRYVHAVSAVLFRIS